MRAMNQLRLLGIAAFRADAPEEPIIRKKRERKLGSD